MRTEMVNARYLLGSGTPNRFRLLCFLRHGMNNLIQGDGIDCHSLLREPEKEFATDL
jgi:hypothetical protein